MEIGDNIAISVISERDEGIWSFVDSFWFALMTLTTVGYDLNPVTLLGKVMHMPYGTCVQGNLWGLIPGLVENQFDYFIYQTLFV